MEVLFYTFNELYYSVPGPLPATLQHNTDFTLGTHPSLHICGFIAFHPPVPKLTLEALMIGSIEVEVFPYEFQ